MTLLAQAVKVAPKDASVLDSYGYVMLKSGGDRESAIALLERAAAAAPGNANIRAHLAEARGG
jgi:Flp pilus assembly protein TadD